MVERRVCLGRLARLRLPFEKHPHALTDRSQHQRAEVDGAGRLDARKRADPREKIPQPHVGRDARVAWLHREAEHAVGREPEIDVPQGDEAPEDEPGGNEQDHRQGNLDHEERRAHALRAAAGGRTFAFHRRQQVRAARVAQRDSACHERHGEDRGKREQRDGRVDGDVGDPWQVIGRQRDDRLRQPLGDREAEHAARDRHEHDLGHPQASECAAGRAERQADPVFVAPP